MSRRDDDDAENDEAAATGEMKPTGRFENFR